MLKSILMASAVLISAPAVAQDMTAAPSTAPQAQAAPTTAPQDTAQPAQTPAPIEQATPVDAAPATTAEASEPAAQGAAATPDQVAQVVDQEFPKYDSSGKGELSQADFGKWMVALRSASEPGFDGQSAEMKTWVGQAFAQADADQSKSVSKTELTSFLSAAS